MHPIENIIKTSMEEINRMADVNTVIGEPIDTGAGTVLLPVSKVSLGFTVGGGEYGSMSGTKKAAQQDAENSHFPFASLSAVGMCLKPMAFVTVEQGNVRVLPAAANCPTDRLTDLVPQVLKSLDRLATAMVDKLAKKCENRENNDEGSPEAGGDGSLDFPPAYTEPDMANGDAE